MSAEGFYADDVWTPSRGSPRRCLASIVFLRVAKTKSVGKDLDWKKSSSSIPFLSKKRSIFSRSSFPPLQKGILEEWTVRVEKTESAYRSKGRNPCVPDRFEFDSRRKGKGSTEDPLEGTRHRSIARWDASTQVRRSSKRRFVASHPNDRRWTVSPYGPPNVDLCYRGGKDPSSMRVERGTALLRIVVRERIFHFSRSERIPSNS